MLEKERYYKQEKPIKRRIVTTDIYDTDEEGNEVLIYSARPALGYEEITKEQYNKLGKKYDDNTLMPSNTIDAAKITKQILAKAKK